MQEPSYTSGCTEKISYRDLHSLSICFYQHKVVFYRVGVRENKFCSHFSFMVFYSTL